MTVVDATTTGAPSADIRQGRLRELQEWALTRTSPQERAAAIDLVLAHDFDEPVHEPVADPVAAQGVRERYLIEVTGISLREPRVTPLATRRTQPATHVPRLAA